MAPLVVFYACFGNLILRNGDAGVRPSRPEVLVDVLDSSISSCSILFGSAARRQFLLKASDAPSVGRSRAFLPGFFKWPHIRAVMVYS